MRQLFVSVATYELGKRIGIEAAGAEFLRQIASPDKNCLPAARIVARLQALDYDVTLFHNWSTDLPKLRSRAAHAFFESLCDQWLMVDDDVETSSATLSDLLQLAGSDSIAALPCLVRGTGSDATSINCVFQSSLLSMRRGVSARACERAGTGLMVVGRGALERLYELTPELEWLDDDGEVKRALFLQILKEGKWYGEDYSFCERVRALGIEIWAPANGASVHAGRPLDLSAIEVRA